MAVLDLNPGWLNPGGGEAGFDGKWWEIFVNQFGQTATGVGIANQLAHRTLRASIATSRRGALSVIVVGLIASWLTVYLAGGADSMVPHLYYIPILFAAARFGPIAALLVAVTASLLAGPLTYVEVASATTQDLSRWLTRSVFFIGIGQLMAWLFEPSLRPFGEEIRRLRDEHEIRRAITKQEFSLVYQPVLCLRTQCFVGVEALIRWHHPERGVVSPGVFMPIAEESNLIHEISDFVLDEACRQAALWRQQSIQKQREPWYMAVNLSGKDLLLPNLATKVEKTLERHGLPPELLHIELTEGVLAHDEAVFQLRQLKRIGLHLSIDDFGTGYSSLSYLDRFPVDTVKIDRSLVKNLGPQPASQALAKGMVLLAESLSLVTVAEGLETEEQLKIGQQLGFDYVQGFLLARPMPPEDIAELLSRPNRERLQQTLSSVMKG
jgi:diguanylate cyclase